jgi:hypothetical protein
MISHTHTHTHTHSHAHSYSYTHSHSHTRGESTHSGRQPSYDDKIKTNKTTVFRVLTPCSPVSDEPAVSVFKFHQQGASSFPRKGRTCVTTPEAVVCSPFLFSMYHRVSPDRPSASSVSSVRAFSVRSHKLLLNTSRHSGTVCTTCTAIIAIYFFPTECFQIQCVRKVAVRL